MSEGESGYRLPLARTDFPHLAASAIGRRAMLAPALLLILAMSLTNIVALLNPPGPGSPLPVAFTLATVARVAAVLFLSAVVLRIAVRSVRPAWAPDRTFWLFSVLFAISFVIPGLLALLPLRMDPIARSAVANVAAVLLVSPFAPWIVAAAVERPLAWRPLNWLVRWQRWLPQRIGWGLALLAPLGILQALLGVAQVQQASAWFWLVAIAGGLLGFAILMIRLGLDAAAYRCVAQE